MVVLPVSTQDIEAIEATLADLLHLKPLWERLLVGEHDGRSVVGLAIGQKVTADSLENHARHLYSLLNVLGAVHGVGPGAIRKVDIPRARLRALRGPEVPAGRSGAAADDGLD